MNHIYLIKRPDVERKMRRRASVAEINVLRQFEGKSLIEDRITRQLGKLHALWFQSGTMRTQ